jgi:hypothetical protein
MYKLNHRCNKLFYFFVTLFFSSLSQSQVVFPVERPVLKVGDTWSYQRTDLWRNEKTAGTTKLAITEILTDRIEYQGVDSQGRGFNRTDNFDLNGIQMVRGQAQITPFYQWPLIDGASRSFKNIATRGANEWTNDGKCVTEGTETVKVQAGEFQTIKIVCKAFWSAGGGGGNWENIIWFAPSAKRAVKVQNKNWQNGRLDTQTQDELVEYKLN